MDASHPQCRTRRQTLFVLFALLFVFSGAAGLLYEVVWSRMLVRVFGVTAFAVSTVLVSFMGGLALGAAVFGGIAERSRRPLRLFAFLEAGVAAYALFLPLPLEGVDFVYATVFPALPESFLLRSIVRFVLCAAVLLVPTVLMGGTLPALGQGLIRDPREIAGGVGLLYFLNTLGAAAGCYLAGFHLIPALGLLRTTLVAAALNASVASAALVFERRWAERIPSSAARSRTPAAGTVGQTAPVTPLAWPLWVAAGSGLAALSFEVVWFRVLILVFGSTVYSFSAMLAVFLAGIAVGSAWIGGIADRSPKPVRLLVWTQGAVAGAAIAGSYAVNWMPELFLRLIRLLGLDFEGMNRTKLLLSSLVLFPPALAFGATFPAAVRLYERAAPGRRIGRVYAWNTVGAILGSFGAGFLALPAIGAEWTLKIVIVVALVLAFGSLLAEPGRLQPAWSFGAASVLVLLGFALLFQPRWDRTLLGAGVYMEPWQFYEPSGRVNVARVVADYELMTFTEGYNDTIISFRSPKGKFITVNGSTTASDQFEDMFSQRMLGHLPMALHPGTVHKACVVGLGAGVTAGVIALYEVEEVVAIELEEGVFEASRFFAEENHDVLRNPRVRIEIDDGRNYLKLTRERFDVISSAPNFPALTGSGALYSAEFFELCRRRLSPGGVMCQFVPIWRLHPEEVRTMVRSFADVFPTIRVFHTGLSLVLLGREEPFPSVSIEEIERRVSRERVRESLLGVGVRGPVELLSFYRFDESEARRWAEGAPRNTDDQPRIEFYAPRALFASTVPVNLEQIGGLLPSREARWSRLGAEPEYESSFLVLAAASDAVAEAQIVLSRGDPRRGMEIALPVAEAGHAYARYVVADHFEKSALAHQRQGELEKARQAFLVALRYEPERLDSMLGLGYVDLFLGNLDEAEKVLEEAAKRYPRSAGALYRLGLVREFQGRPGEAEALYRRATELQPLLSQPWALLGHALLMRGEAAAALECLARAVDLGEATEGVLTGMAAAHLAVGASRKALRWAEEATKRYPESREAFDLLARVAEARGDLELAQRARERQRQLSERSR